MSTIRQVMRGRHGSLRGLTLIEMIVFVVVVSIAVAGILVVMNVTTKHSGDAQLRKQALSIAEGILEEVEMARFTYCDPQDPAATTATSVSQCTTYPEVPGPEANNTRPYDNVNDYINTSAGGALGKGVNFPLTDVNNNAVGNITGTYTAILTISKASLPSLETDSGASATIGSVLQITVEVDYNGGGGNDKVILDGYRTQYAPDLMP